jgi:MoxR-like ATPase
LAHPIESLRAVTTPAEIVQLQETARTVYVDDLIKGYIVSITQATRGHADLALGSSPRGSLALFRGSQATALVRGRDFVLPDDVKELAVPMISHRVIVSAAARMQGIRGRDVISSLVEQVPVPGAQARGWLRR